MTNIGIAKNAKKTAKTEVEAIKPIFLERWHIKAAKHLKIVTVLQTLCIKLEYNFDQLEG